ncbi:bifunctional 23S rRNA (guanine(2069)-N(7))-methyltransferase RlmK/23S rRNA (guanine(2445)-N(2))-methyltransferase RlmL [Gynuella sunshinyii]|uniref:Ribosomal RNA large subunit methyltransferase K/L n=1 Tax=Gynuella sunshinyii YC6258 TaxID=1445510 RepID=A0A0C5V942_9GAMM|nr:bifunctional 23S rRNA (guanine(2069)-N(7))-methyltransferase RlmK/23S rRNA (guanine(2445)-N(2))-methyltransferase RlmL [Gynuella sunshinyii]AJQ95885.1 putative N6-adenine-specific DNA methylase [Gynuella sunshinyii YC6258]
MNSLLIVSCPKGVEQLLLEELIQLGLEHPKETVGAISGYASAEVYYRILLWSRLASRVALVLASGPVTTFETLAFHINTVDWTEHLRASGSFKVQFKGELKDIRNEVFGAQKTKDVVVDQFRLKTGVRPSVQKDQPDIVIDIRIKKGQATIALDLSGEPLHRRGYRLAGSKAPLKENLAAAVLLRAGWPMIAARQGALVDPMCGSGTFLIEAAWMAGDRAPGLTRRYFGFKGWLQHDHELWNRLLEEARQRRAAGEAGIPPLLGYDADAGVIRNANENIHRAGLKGVAFAYHKELAEWVKPTHIDLNPGLLICNPPYGERLGEINSLKGLYRYLGRLLVSQLLGWQAAVLTGNPDLGHAMGLRAGKQYRIFNGSIDCKILTFDIDEQAVRKSEKKSEAGQVELSEGAQMFANRLAKNLKKAKKWPQTLNTDAYRLYDADLPEYSVAVDLYGNYLHVSEYKAPAKIPEEKTQARLADIMTALPQVMQVPEDHIYLKERKRQKGKQQYEKFAAVSKEVIVSENGLEVIVNLSDFLDTGLFLDHRPIRHYIQTHSKGKSFLNLFCYTGVASLHAAKGKASKTTSVDLSKTYLKWAQRNFELNGFSDRHHQFVEADCKQWLQQAAKEGSKYDLIFMDPPSFSNSKKMIEVLDIQQDHSELIHGAMKLLSQDGVLIFSNNQRKFVLDETLTMRFAVEDITAQTIPLDFARTPNIHRCWMIRHPR